MQTSEYQEIRCPSCNALWAHQKPGILSPVDFSPMIPVEGVNMSGPTKVECRDCGAKAKLTPREAES